jgi:hypothetical protein
MKSQGKFRYRNTFYEASPALSKSSRNDVKVRTQEIFGKIWENKMKIFGNGKWEMGIWEMGNGNLGNGKLEITSIHKLFMLDPTMIVDMISDNSLIIDIKVNSKDVSVHYMTTLMKRKYNIILDCLRVTSEGQDPAIGDLQRQNKLLMRQVAMLTDRLDKIEKREVDDDQIRKLVNRIDKSDNQFNTLSMCVAIIEFSDADWRKDIMIEYLNDIVDISKI